MAKRFSINATTIAAMTAVAAIILGIVDSMQTSPHNPLSVVACVSRWPPSLGGRTYEDWNAVAELLRERGAQVPTYWNFEGGEALVEASP